MITFEDGTLGHVFQILRTPVELHAHLHTHAVAVVQESVLVIQEGTTDDLHHADTKRSSSGFCAIAVLIHHTTLLTQTAQCEVTHHDDGTCRFVLLTGSLVHYPTPVSTVDATLHLEFMMGVLILIPEMEYAISDGKEKKGRRSHGTDPCPLCGLSGKRLRILRGVIANSHHDEEQEEEVIRCIVDVMLVHHTEKR